MNEDILYRYGTTGFIDDLESIHVSLSKRQLCQFLRYYELLVEWNGFMNLTAITDFDNVMQKHFVDSLSLAPFFRPESENTMIDIGTGAGFPGLPLKILYPDLRVTLLDSLNKRIGFLNTVVDELSLTGVETIHGRAEDFAKAGKLRSSFDIVVSRAVANLSTLSEYCLPFVKTGGMFISFKSEKADEELAHAAHALDLLGGEVLKVERFMLPSSELSRSLIFVKKIKETPSRFPRKAGLPSKEPLI